MADNNYGWGDAYAEEGVRQSIEKSESKIMNMLLDLDKRMKVVENIILKKDTTKPVEIKKI